MRPSLGSWINDVVRPLSLRLVGGEQEPGRPAAALFARPAVKKGANPSETPLTARLKEFVTYRNDVLGHGARRRDEQYEADVRAWLPLVHDLLDAIATLASWRLALVADVDRSQPWMGVEPGSANAFEPGAFTGAQVGQFVLRGPEGQVRELFPFLGYFPVSDREQRLHYYDSFQNSGRNALELEYDEGFRRPFPEPVASFQASFTADLLAKALKRDRARMVEIEGRIAGFGELIAAEAEIVGRQFAIGHVRRFIDENDRGMLVIVAEPGKGKTALMAHLVDRVFDQNAPEPVCFFYRRTAGITDPDVCVRSLFHALLEAHHLTEAEVALPADPSRPPGDPGDEQYLKLNNLLTRHVALRADPRPPSTDLHRRPRRVGTRPHGQVRLPAPAREPPRGRLCSRIDPPGRRPQDPRRSRLVVRPRHPRASERPHRRRSCTLRPNRFLGELPVSPRRPRRKSPGSPRGNFLVLKHLCRHIRTELPPAEVPAFLRSLATDSGTDRSGQEMLGFLYAKEWDRIASRLDTADRQALLGVGGLLVAAECPADRRVDLGPARPLLRLLGPRASPAGAVPDLPLYRVSTASRRRPTACTMRRSPTSSVRRPLL